MKRDGGNGKPKQLKEVQITAKAPKRQRSVTTSGEVKTSRIDSIRKANPSAGRAIGKGYKGSGGMTTYGPDASDVIKAALNKSTQAAKKGK